MPSVNQYKSHNFGNLLKNLQQLVLLYLPVPRNIDRLHKLLEFFHLYMLTLLLQQQIIHQPVQLHLLQRPVSIHIILPEHLIHRLKQLLFRVFRHILQMHPDQHTQPQQTTSPQKPSAYKIPINHSQIGIYADPSLQGTQQLGQGVSIAVISHESRSGGFTKYIVYHIVGEDKNGKIDVYRRFNQIYKMRVALVKRFPGCFVPSIPDKSVSIIDNEIANKRQRFLNDFVRKMSRLPHLYFSQQFQALIRSSEKDLSNTFEKWPNPTTSDIINKYKDYFLDLAGKVINNQVRMKIHDFNKSVQLGEKYIFQYKTMIKSLAESRDKFDRAFPSLFSVNLPNYESEVMKYYVNDDEDKLLACNASQAKFQQHGAVVKQTLKHNPYWLLYDLFKHEERDSKAFLEASKAVEEYQNKKHEIDIKMSQNNRSITQNVQSKKPNSQQRYKLQVENQNLKTEKESIECLTDIIIALVAFVEIDRFKKEKSLFYENFIRKLGGYEINMVQNMAELWKDWKVKTQKLLENHHNI